MDIEKAIKTRRSVRAYKPEEVSKKKLEKVLEAGRLAPSARNLQEYKFVVVRDKKKIEDLAEAANSQSFISQAPLVIAVVSLSPERFMSCGVPSYAVDGAITTIQMMLAATSEGLGTCRIGAFSQERVKEILDIPYQYKVVSLFPLGVPDDSPKPKLRKEIEEITCYDKFEE